MQDKLIIVTKILAYFSDNNVIDSILANLKDVRLNMNRNMLILDKEIKNASLFVDFKTFLTYTFQKAIERVGPSYRTRLSDILIT
jgi:hypothetical protein